ncbi:MAG TPA: hypothetical protein VG013_12205 [Gemmataceae bacterium]|jgi:hypothetical protein|nr:hypothetical protein [Gemmataceae bacterium]
MQYPWSVLTAAWLAGAAVVAPSGANNQTPLPAAQQQVIAPEPTDTQPAGPTSLRERLRHLFAPRHAEEGANQAPPPGVQVPPSPQAIPNGPASQLGPITPQRPDVQLSKKDLDRIGHEQDYSWVTGRLVRVASGGRWEIRYAGPGEVDRYGGSLVLAPSGELTKFHDGDLVCLHGKVVGHGPALRAAAGSVYQAASIDLIERASH